MKRPLSTAALVTAAIGARAAIAQQVTIQVPQHVVQERFDESLYGPAPLVSHSSSWTTTTPILTVTSGVPGFLFAGRTVPFVAGIVPVGPPAFNPAFVNLGPANTIGGRLQRGEMAIRNGRIVSGPATDPPPPELMAPPPLMAPPAGHEAPGAEVEAIVAARQLASQETLINAAREEAQSTDRASELVAKGAMLEAEGKPGAARLLYQTALRQAHTELKQRIEQHLDRLSPPQQHE